MSRYCFISKLRKGAGFSTCSMLPMLSVLSGVLIALQLLLSSVAYASSTASGYTFGNKQPLDQASVSVVRFLVTYTAPPVPPAPACSTTSTGLGVLVGSWPTTAGSTDVTNWIMTDGSLIDPHGISCGTGKPTEALSTIQIYVNDAYTNATGNLASSLLKTLTCTPTDCTDGSASASITCQVSPICSGGVVLVPFHTTTPQPFIDVATADQTQTSSTAQAPFGIGLASPTTGTSTPTPAQATQLLAPVQVPNITDPKNELGMPIVNTLGQLLDMTTKAVDTGGSIRSFVTGQLSPGQTGHTNSLRDSWHNGIAAYYAGDYVNAQTDFRNAGTHNNLFRAGVAFWTLATAKAGNGGTGANGGSTGKTLTPGKTPGSNSNSAPNSVNLFGYSISDSLFTALVVGALVLLIIILALITFAVVRRQARHRKEFAELNRRAEVDAAHIAQKEKEESLRTHQRWNSPQSFNPVNAAPPVQAQAQPVPNLRCPNCGTPVSQTDNFCPNCRSPLSLTDSGLNVRLNKPPISSPLPAVSQASPVAGLAPSTAFSDMPTEEIPFGAAGTVGAAQNGNEKTTPLIVRNSTPRSASPVEQFSGHKLGLIVGTQSDPGIKRKHKPNEDSIFAAEGMLNNNVQAPAFGLFVVADGMGGHANGQDASRLAIKTIVDTLMPRLTSNEPFTDDDFAHLLADGVQKANMAVHQRNLEHHADMGTTMTATLIIGTNAYMANVGDSRTYLYRQPEGLKKITNDHSVVASLVDAGIIKPDDIYTHPKRNQIYRSLGEKPVVDVDTFKVPLKPGDKIILCSDGLWDMVRDPIIEQVLNTVPDPTQTRHALIQAALDGGGEDNVSVIVIHIANSPQGAGLSGVQVLAQPEAPQYPPM